MGRNKRRGDASVTSSTRLMGSALVFVNSAVYVLFGSSFFKPQTVRD